MVLPGAPSKVETATWNCRKKAQKSQKAFQFFLWLLVPSCGHSPSAATLTSPFHTLRQLLRCLEIK